ncbi:MAG: hypothetical protein ACKOW9_02315 [Candidatus Paceibacterota bacterium]
MQNKGFFLNTLLIIIAIVVGMYYLDKQGKLTYVEEMYQQVMSYINQATGSIEKTQDVQAKIEANQKDIEKELNQ